MKKFEMFDVFKCFILRKNTNESNYLIAKMIDDKYIDPKFLNEMKLNLKAKQYFAHYLGKEKSTQQKLNLSIEYYKELSKNDWKLHKQLIKEGVNPNEIAKIIRNDDIEKLQEISSPTKFDFNQTIEPSLYERCSFINKENVSLIAYASYFGSVKCFKYLLMNNARLVNVGKYAVAGGNLEIIHLCEQNHSTFEDVYEIAIEFHRNDIFKYLYEMKVPQNNLSELGKKCILYHNYEIFTFLQKGGMKIDESHIKKSASIGNIFLLKYIHIFNHLPENILIFSSRSGNFELVKYIFEQKKN